MEKGDKVRLHIRVSPEIVDRLRGVYLRQRELRQQGRRMHYQTFSSFVEGIFSDFLEGPERWKERSKRIEDMPNDPFFDEIVKLTDDDVKKLSSY